MSRVLALVSFIPALIITAPPAHAGLYSFTTHTFTPCTATGKAGPTLAQCQSAYGTSWSSNSSYYTVTNGIQYWTAPTTAQYQITAAGAVGAGGNKTEGLGAIIRATVTLTQGTTYKILVGQAGINGNNLATNTSGGGGGGTFLTTSTNTPIIVAGGGAGSHTLNVSSATTANGQTTTSGAAASDGSGVGGTNGGGGTGSNLGWGSGGGGLTGDGTKSVSCTATASQGIAFTNGGAGGTSCVSYNAHGGFGGGGATHGYSGGGGGGGGYSGGGGSNQSGTANGGGGGSFVMAGATNIATSNGSYAGSTSGITNLGLYNGTYLASTYAAGYLTIEILLDPVSVTVAPTTGGYERSYRTSFQLTATLSAAGGTVTFYQQGKRIAGCIKVVTATSTATCSWSPTVKGSITITATVSPTTGAVGLPSNKAVFLIGKRSTTR